MSRYLFISITVHITLLLALSRFMLWQPNSISDDVPIINIYTLNHNQKISTSSKYHKAITKKNTGSIKNIKLRSPKQQLSQLKITIHNLIKSRLKYPSNIRFLVGPKKIIASLVIFPDGHIDNAKILKSSGLAIFDREALEAISSLPPIKEAQSFIKKPTPLEIPIEFRQN